MLDMRRVNCTKLVKAKSINIDAMVELSYDRFCQEKYDVVYWTENPVTASDYSKTLIDLCVGCSRETIREGLSLYGDVIVARTTVFVSVLNGVQVCSRVTLENTVAIQRVCDYIKNSSSKVVLCLAGA